jgi:hypothetical protein
MSFLSTRSVAAAAAVGLGIATMTGLGAVPASADAPSLHVVQTLSSAYVAPLQFAVNSRSVFVADAAASALFKIGRSAPIATGPAPTSNPETSGDLAGVAIHDGTIAYTTSSGDHKDTRLTILRHGHKKVVSLSAFEQKYNPDRRNAYGLVNASSVSSQCKAELTANHAPLSYTGLVDSHPYAVASLGDDAWAVADAGGNDILKVDKLGHVSLIAVLPPQSLKVTSAVATALHTPHCAGVTYRTEPVPTDIEVGPHGKLFVSTLPGGPDGPGLPARGSVYQVGSGWTHRLATGFAGATNLAVGPSGWIYVAQLSAGTIAVVHDGKPRVVATLKGVAGLEWANGHLYASTAPAVTGGSGPGTVVVLG